MKKTTNPQPNHHRYMQLAIDLAARARGWTSPNPMVGAVIVKGGEIVGQGYHHRAGGPHAEVLALKQAGSRAKGATLYLNLEPCSHFGRTPPCAPAVAGAGIKKVVAAMKDPNPMVAGRGFKILKSAGVEVVTGVMETEARRLNEVFIKHVTTDLPFVTIKGAVTLDGKTATASGESKWITGEAARKDVHKLRSENDAVLVGIGTVLADDPQLNCRLPGRHRQPYRIVLDAGLKTPPGANIVKQAADGKTIIAASEKADEKKARRLEKQGCLILRLPSDKQGNVSIEQLLIELSAMEIISVLVEGGGTVNFSFIKSNLADKIVLYIAPRLLGGASAHTFMDGEGFSHIADVAKIKEMKVEYVGKDMKIEAGLQTVIFDVC